MKIKTEIEVTLSAKAIYRDNVVFLSVGATVPYADRQASATINGASDEVTEMFARAFEALIAEQQEETVKAAQAAQAECLTVAARMGEL